MKIVIPNKIGELKNFNIMSLQHSTEEGAAEREKRLQCYSALLHAAIQLIYLSGGTQNIQSLQIQPAMEMRLKYYSIQFWKFIFILLNNHM